MATQLSTAPTGSDKASDWQALIDKTRGGCDEAPGEVSDRLRGYLLLIRKQRIGRRLQSTFSASDIFQVSLVEAKDSFENFARSTKQEVKDWLKRIMMHNLIGESRRYTQTQMRSLQRETPLDQCETLLKDPCQPTPDVTMIQRETDEQLQRMISQLPIRQQQVLELKHRYGFSQSQIAQ